MKPASLRKLKLRNNFAFTLIEVLVVLAVIGILTTIVVGGFRRTQRRGRDVQRKSDLKQMARAMEIYLSDYGNYPPSAANGRIMGCPAETTACEWSSGEFRDATGNIYFKNLPADPLSNQSYFYRAFDSNQKYQIFARLENPKDQDCLGGNCSPDPVFLPSGVSCESSDVCNFAVYSPNVRLAETFSAPSPTPTLIPTPTPTFTPTPIPTPTPTFTPTPIPTPTPTPTPVIIEVRVAASSDDAEENVNNGSIDLTSSDLELISPGSIDQEVGMRFRSLTMPQGSNILNAYIEFETDETDSGTTNLTFYAQDIDDAPTFTTATDNISSRVKTSASVAWNNVPAWNTISEKHQTPNLSPIIQEVINRPGWISGFDIVVIVTGSGKRVAESYNGESANAPLLHVEYQ